MLAVIGFRLMQYSPLLNDSPDEQVRIPRILEDDDSLGDQYRIPRGPDGGPFRLGLVVCRLSDDAQSVATSVLEGRQNHNPKFEVDVYVTGEEPIESVVGFLKKLSSFGVSSGVRVVVANPNGSATFGQFNTSPLGAFKDYQEYKDMINNSANKAQ